ncbi:nuclear transport factor 2 family protein [Pseudonocardia alaniniphila]|uniref:Nuclear transport factor 2 family protein n=1 Tax=Pseudonocardia alaniniphila TaxID=75291 RepID=A0ABS9TUZ2_9PSEU|nr:nuclear transport factor 2 family protein [Pseudonocardia alaniniphila]MCH6172377.1 nuclear transport factor 2 family protein [Pseudonocardia alaniniphila]
MSTLATTERNRELIRQVYALAAAGDLEAVAPFHSDDYRLSQSPSHPVPGSWTGAAATDAGIEIFRACGTSGVTVLEIVADGPHRVVAIVDAHGTAPVSGERWTMLVSEHFWIEDGRITEIRPFYWDPAGLRRILGVG